MIFKLFFTLKKTVFPLLLCGIGIFLLAAPYNPGAISNIVAWLETDGSGISLCVGSLAVLIGILALYFSLRSVIGKLYIVHGKLSCLVTQGVIQEIVEQVLDEYFEQKDLHAQVSLSKNYLHVVVEVPEAATSADITKFTEYLRDRLFLLAGYYGKIYLLSQVGTPEKIR